MQPLLQLANVTCRKGGRVRAGHGLEIDITVDTEKTTESTWQFISDGACNVKLDLTGEVFKAMPSGTATLADFLLPIALRDMEFKLANLNRSSPSFTFLLGAKKLSHKTLVARLSDLAGDKGGDPVFTIDLVCTNKTNKPFLLARCDTKASLMLEQLQSPRKKNINAGNIAIFQPSSLQQIKTLHQQADKKIRTNSFMLTFYFIRWWLYAIVYAVLAWMILIIPEHTINRIPENWRLLWLHSDVSFNSTMSHLSPLPTTRSQAFQLGMIWARLVSSETTLGNVTSLLDQASAILKPQESRFGLSQSSSVAISEDDLQSMLQRLVDEETQVTLAARVASMFSFINFVWLLSIVGITVSIGPSLWVILRPFRDFLEKWAKRLLKHVLEPFVRNCHEYGLFELLLWITGYMLLMDSYRFYGVDAGLYVCLTSVGVNCLGLGYSAFRHSKPFAHMKGRPDVLYNRYCVAALMPLALVFHSQLIAFVVVASVYYLLGFSVVCVGLCWFIGFEREDIMARCASCSAIILAILVVLRLNLPFDSIYNEVLDPFRTPLSIFGSIVLNLALLIISYPDYVSSRSSRSAAEARSIVWRNLLMIGTLTFQLIFGETVGLPGMYNTACVFSLFWMSMHYSRFHFEVAHWNTWVFVLIASLATWQTALWLHAHPGFVIKCFTQGA